LNIILLNVIMLSVIMLSVIMLNVIMLNLMMLNVIMPNVIMPDAIKLSVVAPINKHKWCDIVTNTGFSHRHSSSNSPATGLQRCPTFS
jgi:hypothetical protein